MFNNQTTQNIAGKKIEQISFLPENESEKSMRKIITQFIQ